MLGACSLGLIRADQRHVHQMFGEEPNLQLVAANHLADQQIVGAIVAGVGGNLGHGMCFLQDDFVGFQQA